jgi:CheY-like chemotaxis protein
MESMPPRKKKRKPAARSRASGKDKKKASPSRQSAPVTSGVKTVLIVEDEKPLAHALNLKLGSEGYQITVANDGASAFTTLRQQQFDLVLLDIVLPQMDGFSVLASLQQSKQAGPNLVVILSNLGQPEDRRKAEALGVTEYLVKANTPMAGIVEKVNMLLR